MKILIDPGHGGDDPGAIANALREADINVQVARHLGDILREQGATVWFTRETDQTVSLTKRAWLEEQLKPDLFVSLHCNAAASDQAHGLEVFTTIGETAADPLASHVLSALQAAFPDRRFRQDLADGDTDREENFYVLRRTRCPAILVEMGFLTHPEEAQWLSQRSTRVQMALALAAGVLGWSLSRREAA